MKLQERLLAVESSSGELGGEIGTNSYRNPDGPEAAAQLDLYEAALQAACEAINVADSVIAINCGLDTPKEWDRAFKAVVKARGRLNSTDTGA